MTTKVIKGSIWTLGGSVLPLAVSFVTTPLIIRFLGTESYGVLLLVGLIPAYFSFADFGMSVASTKFAAEAFGEGDERKEAEFVWTAAAIASVSALIVAIPIFLFSYFIVRWMNVPEHLLDQASIALKITTGSFFFGILGSVLNSPMLARLRMDLNMLTSGIPKLLLAAVTPFILYFGGGVVEAVGWAFIVAAATFATVFYFSIRLLPSLLLHFFNSNLIRPLIKFGAATFIASAAALVLGNLEKLFLTKMVSVQALAYYSVAFTFANTSTMFSLAMLQSLIPAFSQVSSPSRSQEFDRLFSQTMRLTMIWTLPMIMILVVIARPLFTLWVGKDFGRESSVPLYVLMCGLLFGLMSFVPVSSITAFGRQEVFAKLYTFELLLFAPLMAVLVYQFGIVGAAIAWSARAVFDSIAMCVIAKRITGHSLKFSSVADVLAFTFFLLSPPILFALFVSNTSLWLVPLVAASLVAFSVLIWKLFLSADERSWVEAVIRRFFVSFG